MIGARTRRWRRLDPVFRSLAPGVAAAPRTPGRIGEPGRPSTATCTAAQSGAGHFVKMIHNGIEYGMMAAYAEG
jgi:6-phosphogluconate dehydrogenase